MVQERVRIVTVQGSDEFVFRKKEERMEPENEKDFVCKSLKKNMLEGE